MLRIRKIGVTLLSGGLDSTTVAAWAKTEGFELAALTFDYGQRHSRELESARRVAEFMGIRHEIVSLPAMSRLSWYSALTTRALSIPANRPLEDLAKDIPVTYVPMRNTVFLTLAAAFLESMVLSLIEKREIDTRDCAASVFIAASAVDYSGYPDCRPEYFEAMRLALFEGSKLGKHYGIPLNIETPVLHMTKASIVRLGMRLGAPLEHTWSCYEGGEVPCGVCDSCLLRSKGFAEAGVEDPLLRRLRREGRIDEGE